LPKTYNSPAELGVIIFEVAPYLDGLLTKVREYRGGKLTDKQFVKSLNDIESHIDAGIKAIHRLKFKEKAHGYASFRIIGAYHQYKQGLALLETFAHTKNGDKLTEAAERIGRSTEILHQCRKLIS
jgi:predicted transcriptional regulator